MTLPDAQLSRQQITDSVHDLGWRLISRNIQCGVPVTSLGEAARVAAQVTEAAGEESAVSIDLRPHRVHVRVAAQAQFWPTPADVETAARISAAVGELGLATSPGLDDNPVQVLEVAIDALDIPAVLPFWAAVLGYIQVSDDAIIDPSWLGPGFWFQQMDKPRPQRNRIHLDVLVPHDAARGRIDAALAAGGTLVSEAEAPAFWVLADPEGNEACVCTWQGRDGSAET
jgi:4a-hydroxytetrahydrobiopterin dehydratase